MSDTVDLLAMGASVVMLTWIGLLPRLFFRPGRRTLQWSLNALPFWVAGVTLLATALGVLEPVRPAPAWLASTLPVASIGLCAAAAWLLIRTLATHDRPLALWHQPDDSPEHLVTSGPYARIRHPFYTSFIITLAGCALATPHVLTLLAFMAGAYRLDRTAKAEEIRLSASDLGGAYSAYMGTTGRFLP